MELESTPRTPRSFPSAWVKLPTQRLSLPPPRPGRAKSAVPRAAPAPHRSQARSIPHGLRHPKKPQGKDSLHRLRSAPLRKVFNFWWFKGNPISWQKVKGLTSKQTAPKIRLRQRYCGFNHGFKVVRTEQVVVFPTILRFDSPLSSPIVLRTDDPGFGPSSEEKDAEENRQGTASGEEKCTSPQKRRPSRRGKLAGKGFVPHHCQGRDMRVV